MTSTTKRRKLEQGFEMETPHDDGEDDYDDENFDERERLKNQSKTGCLILGDYDRNRGISEKDTMVDNLKQ